MVRLARDPELAAAFRFVDENKQILRPFVTMWREEEEFWLRENDYLRQQLASRWRYFGNALVGALGILLIGLLAMLTLTLVTP